MEEYVPGAQSVQVRSRSADHWPTAQQAALLRRAYFKGGHGEQAQRGVHLGIN